MTEMLKFYNYHLEPDYDGTYDLGTPSREFKDLYLTGTLFTDGIRMQDNEYLVFGPGDIGESKGYSYIGGDGSGLELYSGYQFTFTSKTDTDIRFAFIGTTKTGYLYWMEDEDYFKFGDDVMMLTSYNIFFRDTNIHIASLTDGHLDLTADISIDLNGVTVATDAIYLTQIDGAEKIDSSADGHTDIHAGTRVNIHNSLNAVCNNDEVVCNNNEVVFGG